PPISGPTCVEAEKSAVGSINRAPTTNSYTQCMSATAPQLRKRRWSHVTTFAFSIGEQYSILHPTHTSTPPTASPSRHPRLPEPPSPSPGAQYPQSTQSQLLH